MGLFRKKESFDETQYNSYEPSPVPERKKGKNYFSSAGTLTSYKEKQAMRAGAAAEYRKNYGVKQSTVEKDYGKLQKGAAAGLSGGTLFGRMTRRR